MKSVTASLFCLMLAASPVSADSRIQQSLKTLKLPPGFSLEVFARIEGAREMAVDPASGAVYVTTRQKELWLVEKGEPILLREGLNGQAGVAVSGTHVFLSETHRLLRFDQQDLFQNRHQAKAIIIDNSLPAKTWHGSRSLAIGPSGKIYIAMGAPCNICQPQGIEDAIIRMNLDGSDREIYAQGIRNSVGMAFHLSSGALFFNDNNVDSMGDNKPAGELNHAPKAGLHFGFPWVLGLGDQHPDFAQQPASLKTQLPVMAYQAHVAALGMAFIRAGHFPDDFTGDLLVAQHGSWDRANPVGYRVLRVFFQGGDKPIKKEVLIDGWLLSDGRSWGRPADIEQAIDGSILISDDRAGFIYRLSYQQP